MHCFEQKQYQLEKEGVFILMSNSLQCTVYAECQNYLTQNSHFGTTQIHALQLHPIIYLSRGYGTAQNAVE